MKEIDYTRKWWVMLAVAMGIFLGTIDGSIVNIALPTLVGTSRTCRRMAASGSTSSARRSSW